MGFGVGWVPVGLGVGVGETTPLKLFDAAYVAVASIAIIKAAAMIALFFFILSPRQRNLLNYIPVYSLLRVHQLINLIPILFKIGRSANTPVKL